MTKDEAFELLAHYGIISETDWRNLQKRFCFSEREADEINEALEVTKTRE